MNRSMKSARVADVSISNTQDAALPEDMVDDDAAWDANGRRSRRRSGRGSSQIPELLLKLFNRLLGVQAIDDEEHHRHHHEMQAQREGYSLIFNSSFATPSQSVQLQYVTTQSTLAYGWLF